jgi:membrane fusion protein (multidrug efflux system)
VLEQEKTKKPRKRPIVALTLIVIMLIGFCLGLFVLARRGSATNSEVVSSSTPVPLKEVAVYLARRRDLTRTTTLSAELRPYNVAKLYAKVSGYLTNLTVDFGSKVSTGEVIGTIDVPEQQATVARAQAAYNLAKLNYGRITSVVHQTPGLIAQQDVDQAKASYIMSKQELDRANVLLGYDQIIVPFSGVVTQRNVDPGALIQDAMTGGSAVPIVEIEQENKLRLVIEVPASIVGDINVGTPVLVHVRGTESTFADTVARLSYAVHEDTRTMHTEVDVDNPDLRYKPGMFADVTLTLARQNDALAVPIQALHSDSKPTVLVVDRHHRLAQRDVTTGLQTSDWVQINAGLKAGESVYLGDPNAVAIGEKVNPQAVSTVTGAQ